MENFRSLDEDKFIDTPTLFIVSENLKQVFILEIATN